MKMAEIEVTPAHLWAIEMFKEREGRITSRT